MDRARIAGQLELGPGDRSGPGAAAVVTDAQRHQLFARARELDLSYADLWRVVRRVAGVVCTRFLPADRFDQVLRELEAAAARRDAETGG